MPLLAALFSFLLTLVPALVAKILLATGIGVVSYVGIQALLSNLTAVVLSNAGSVTADMAGILGMLRMDVCISMVLSALSIRIALQTANGVLSKVSFTNRSVTP
jgi:hypothetical protein